MSLVGISAIIVCYLVPVLAFGAGKIPSYSGLKRKAYRHGDIDDVFTLWVEDGGTKTAYPHRSNALRWNWSVESDQKQLYLGNWERDSSQLIDTRPLERFSVDLLVTFAIVWGFLSEGYSGEVTREKLGVYRPEEHIDNPRGYGKNLADPRALDKRLRGPVQEIETQIDPRTGMKNYIRNERGDYMTSSAHIKKLTKECIRLAREYRKTNRRSYRSEAIRLLGSILHTLEDYMAHSNWLELTLIELSRHPSYQDTVLRDPLSRVFPHVGHSTLLRLPNGVKAYPIVTGTFGGTDFSHSLMGEVADSISEMSTKELRNEMKRHRRLQKETERAAKAKYKEGSMQRIQYLMQEFAAGVGCPLPETGVPGISRADAGMENNGLRMHKRQEPAGCTPLNFDGPLWRFYETFDARKFVIEAFGDYNVDPALELVDETEFDETTSQELNKRGWGDDTGEQLRKAEKKTKKHQEKSWKKQEKAERIFKHTQEAKAQAERELMEVLAQPEGKSLKKKAKAEKKYHHMQDENAKADQELMQATQNVIKFRTEVTNMLGEDRFRRFRHDPRVQNIQSNVVIWMIKSLAPLLAPLIQLVTNHLNHRSDRLISKDEDQQRCFKDPHCSDPTHSWLSKDHFRTLLNEPAGRVATEITAHTIEIVVNAWENQFVDVDLVAEEVLEPLFHPSLPYLRNGEFTPIQITMMNTVIAWLESYPLHEQLDILDRLTLQSVLEHRNERSNDLHDKLWVWEQHDVHGAEEVRKFVKGEGFSAGPFQSFWDQKHSRQTREQQ
ncbi:hypothetical protein FRB97_002036 [Tulasnella sp. 331]|nr:hypothetical protein FRB97_002036 [Tulasnella sp. 331]